MRSPRDPASRIVLSKAACCALTMMLMACGCSVLDNSIFDGTPRLLQPQQSTIRPQNSRLAAAVNDPPEQAAANYPDSSQPAVPPFGPPTAGAPNANLQHPDFTGRIPAPAVETAPDVRLPVISSGPPFGGHSVHQPRSQAGTSARPRIALDASAIRQMLNDQSANAMSEGTVLQDLPATMQTTTPTASPALPLRTGPAPQGGVQPVAAPAPPAFGSDVQPAMSEAAVPPITIRPDAIPEPTNDPVNAVQMQPMEEAPAMDAAPGQPTMLERLRGIYDPIETNSRELFRRPFQRLPTPWSILRERDANEESIPVQTADVSPGVSVDSSGTAPQARPAGTSSLLLELIERMDQQLQTWPRTADGNPVEPQRFRQAEIDLRLLYLIADQPGAAIAALGSLPPAEQDFWQELMLGVSQYRTRDPELTQEQHLANVVGQLSSAVGHAQPLSALVIRRLDFCSRIDGFGRTELFPSNDFNPGQPVLIYAELENVGSELRSGGVYATRFSAVLQVFRKGDTEPIETITLSDIEDQTGTQRRDYFQSFELTIPGHLWSAKYEIRLRLRDQITQRETSGVLDFQVR